MKCVKYTNERGDPVYVTEPTVKLVIEAYKAEQLADEDLSKAFLEKIIEILVKEMDDQNHPHFAFRMPYTHSSEDEIGFYSGDLKVAPFANAVLAAIFGKGQL